MKKVINGKVYDTSTARPVAMHDNGHSISDFAYFRETLYCKKTGEYFLHGEGHAHSRYGKWIGDSGGWGWGEEIHPYTLQEAQEWAQKNMAGADYKAEFGDPEDDDGRVMLGISIAATTKARLERMRQESGKSISRLIDELVAGSN